MARKKTLVACYEKSVHVNGKGRAIEIETCIPMPKDAFEIEIRKEIIQLRKKEDESLHVELKKDNVDGEFIRCERWSENDYQIFCACHKKNNELHVYRTFEVEPEAVIDLFYKVLCQNVNPLTYPDWEDITDGNYDDRTFEEVEEDEKDWHLGEDDKKAFKVLSREYLETFGKPFETESFEEDEIALCNFLMATCLSKGKPLGDPDCPVKRILKYRDKK